MGSISCVYKCPISKIEKKTLSSFFSFFPEELLSLWGTHTQKSFSLHRLSAEYIYTHLWDGRYTWSLAYRFPSISTFIYYCCFSLVYKEDRENWKGGWKEHWARDHSGRIPFKVGYVTWIDFLLFCKALVVCYQQSGWRATPQWKRDTLCLYLFPAGILWVINTIETVLSRW